MKKTFTKLTLAALTVCGFGTAFTTAAFGGFILTSEEIAKRQEIAVLNSSYDTLQVVRGSDEVHISAYELFNFAATAYSSATGQSVATFDNAADFYADRGVKSLVSDWTVSEGSQIVGMYRTSYLAHSIDLTNSTGTVWNPIAVGQGQSYDNQGTWIDSLDSSRNIDVGAIGAVNMTLTASWKPNIANDDPVWVDGLSDAEKAARRNLYDRYGDFSQIIYGDQPELNGGVISMVAYDVTDLLKAMGYADIENAFMFTWEMWNSGTELGRHNDFDYNDMVYIMTNVSPNIISVTPEPATMLIIGLGLAGLGLARRRRKK
ncbi:hypothetical protein FACS189454_03320 [Planctomycetales bacterium]|nr:hypothetical protein FACS189454_03320 [Planctomycetales bacterium]